MMPAVSLANLATYSLQIAMVVAVGAGTLWALRLQSPRVRLACLRGTLVACLVLPFTVSMRPAQPSAGAHVASQPASTTDLETTVEGRRPAATLATGPAMVQPTETWLEPVRAATVRALPLVFLAGIAARLVWLGVGLMALNRLRRRARFLTSVDARPPALVSASCTDTPAIAAAGELVGTRAEFLVSPAVTRPVTFGMLRPVVLLPETFASLDSIEQEAIGVHELLHVRRRDWVQTIVEELLRAAFWFNPAIWWLLGQVDLAREQVVDQEVVALTSRRQPYVSALLRLATLPAGPVLRPASLFLGRAHLVKRVALLSREVRMSRWRLAVSVVLVAAAVALGGHFVVLALPLTAAEGTAAAAVSASTSTAMPSPANRAGAPAATDVSPQAKSNLAPRVIQTVPPSLAPGNVETGKDAVVAVAATVGTAGVIDGAVALYADTGGKVTATASNPAAADRIIDGAMIPAATAARMHAALDALRLWRFQAMATPASVYVGFNFAADQSASFEPVRIGGGIRQPAKVKDVRPVYPEGAQNQGIQGVVILELLIDGATGIPAQAIALRPVDSLTIPAIEAALQWRFAPTPEYLRLQMTVTVNFTLAGGVVGGMVSGVPGMPPPPPPPPPQTPSTWPQNALRVGGNIKAPTRTVYVPPVYPAIAQQARVQGVVIVEVLIGPDGKVADARVLRSIPLLDQAALDAVRQWQFTPTLLNGNPVPVIMTATVNFTLEDTLAGGVLGGVSGGVQGGVAGGISSVAPDVASTTWPQNPVRVGGNIKQPTKIVDARPVYPQVAQSAHVQGVVIVEVLIGPDGTVQDAKILRSIPLLDQAALDAVRQWQFTPTLLNGVPVPVIMTCTVNFTLEAPQPREASQELTAGVYRPGAIDVTTPRVVYESKPSYDPVAYRDKVQGTVVVEAVVGPDGTVQDVKVIKPLDPRLDPRAVEAAYNWRFTPGTKNGVPVPVIVTMELMFRLR